MLRKIAEIKVPKGAGPREAKTNPIFATYDRQGAAFAFYFSDSNIAGATANLLFMVDGQKVFVDDGVTLGETNETHTFTYPLPDKLLNYTGKVDGYLYFDFEDGSHSDEIHFVFTIKKSRIDEEVGDAPDVYIKSFEDAKAEVQEAADGAKETISQKVTEVSDTSDSAISKVNQAADGAIKAASEAKSDVQSKKEEASYSIDEVVKSTESARDEAIKTMNEIDYSDRNLLTGTSDEWEKTNDKFTGYSGTGYPLVRSDLSEGETVTYSVEIDNTIDQQNDSDLFSVLRFTLNNDHIKPFEGNRIPSGEKGVSSVTCVVPSDVKETRHVKVAQHPLGTQKVGAYRKPTLNHGPLVAPWQPATEEIVTQDQYNKLVNAITILGGSI